MRRLGACFFSVLVSGCVFAQSAASTAHPSGEARVVRVQIGYICGWCGGLAYRTDLTTVGRRFVRRGLLDSTNTKKLPNRREQRAITRREWETLVRSIDANALKAVPQEKGCRPCVDQPESWAVIEYSDGSKISVNYAPMSEPAPVKAMKIPGIAITFFP